jgi:hypothetical protein
MFDGIKSTGKEGGETLVPGQGLTAVSLLGKDAHRNQKGYEHLPRDYSLTHIQSEISSPLLFNHRMGVLDGTRRVPRAPFQDKKH